MSSSHDSLRLPDLAEIRAAHERIARYVTRTPVINSPALDAAVGATIFLKCENLQRVGAFKARGACNAVLSLSDAAAKHGVVTHRRAITARRWPTPRSAAASRRTW